MAEALLHLGDESTALGSNISWMISDKSLGAKRRANQVSFSREADLRLPTPVHGTAKEMQNDFHTTTSLNYVQLLRFCCQLVMTAGNLAQLPQQNCRN